MLLAQNNDYKGIANESYKQNHRHDVSINGNCQFRRTIPYGSIDIVAGMIVKTHPKWIDL